MASRPPFATPAPGMPGADQLSGPPPSPDVAAAVAGPPPGPRGTKALVPPDEKAKEMFAGITQAADQIDQILMAMARAMPPGAKDFEAARRAITQGVKRGLEKAGEAPANSPVATGANFPGRPTAGL